VNSFRETLKFQDQKYLKVFLHITEAPHTVVYFKIIEGIVNKFVAKKKIIWENLTSK
jgi:hypothetical protein